MKFLIPWVGFALSLVAAAILYSQKRQAGEELALGRAAVAELAELRAEVEELKKGAGDEGEIARLRAENAELHRLRNEIRTLRGRTGGAAAVAAATSAPAPVISAVEESPRLKQEIEELKAERDKIQGDVCGQHLSGIQAAIQQWASENNKRAGENVLMQYLTPYIKDEGIMLCPGGGTYTIRPYGMPPQCSIPAHVIGR